MSGAKYVLGIIATLFGILICYRITLLTMKLLVNKQHTFEEIILLIILLASFVLALCVFKSIYDRVILSQDSTILQRIGVIFSCLGLGLIAVYVLLHTDSDVQRTTLLGKDISATRNFFAWGAIITLLGLEMSSQIVVNSVTRLYNWISSGK